jgi:murein DD-endopeptidase MepM/ murein hydrolase activator NlpD
MMEPSDYALECISDWQSPFYVRVLAQLTALIWRWHNDHTGQRPLLGRVAAHVGLMLTLAFFMVLGSLRADSIATLRRMVDGKLLDGLVQSVDAASNVASPLGQPYDTSNARAQIARSAQHHTAIPKRARLDIVTYTVQAGDTAETIAEKFDLQPTTLLWSNPEMEKMPDLLKVGQVLTILPIDGVYHKVESADTLESLAKEYKVEITDITSCPFNDLPEEGILSVGSQIIVPGGTKPYETRKVTTYSGPVEETVQSAGIFYWPAAGSLTQGYWYGHRAIDIGAPLRTSIIAADGGYVSFAGWTDIGYGYLVVINHQNGFETYYAHLSDIFVSEGDTVAATQVIGAMGSTGNSTGPHLHFEIRYNAYPNNPLLYLR